MLKIIHHVHETSGLSFCHKAASKGIAIVLANELTLQLIDVLVFIYKQVFNTLPYLLCCRLVFFQEATSEKYLVIVVNSSTFPQEILIFLTYPTFHILVVADPSYQLSIQDDLLAQLQAAFPASVRFEIVPVERIEPDPSGKIRMLISEVEGDA